MNFAFNSITWHDAELLKISIDRAAPGERDIIEFEIVNDIDGAILVTFLGVWQMTCSLNFGIICAETIRQAFCADSHEELDRLRTKWNRTGVNMSDISLFEFETNSTGSSIRIIAEDIKIVKRTQPA